MKEQITLGKLIVALENLDSDVQLSIGNPHSFRGNYNEIAICILDYLRDTEEVLAEVKACVGREFCGYKGGVFRITEDTPVWITHCWWGEGKKLLGIEPDGCVDC